VRSNNAITPNHEITTGADDGRAVSNEATFPYPDRATFCKSLIPYGRFGVLICMVLVDYKDILCDQNAPLDVDAIFCVNLRSPADNAVVLDHNYWLADFIWTSAHS
jgi:hypothetical protein